ncbi:MAG: UTP--glucose-1-phosphate uridylyltransferase [Planctomycetales bacterium]|nr:UTP--glucose-1-phosphate uridylyltransferase [Planctomycetales bacterium]
MSTDNQDSPRLGGSRWDDAGQDPLVQIIVADDDATRNRSLDEVCAAKSLAQLEQHLTALDAFWRRTDNLYHRVRALFFLSAIHRFHIPKALGQQRPGKIPFGSYEHLLDRRFIEALDSLLLEQQSCGFSDGLSSALAHAYRDLAFQTLANQVRKSVRTVRGNQWMFRTGHPADHPLRIRGELLERDEHGLAPTMVERTAVRMDFSHSGWSDIFFLGMDFPAGAKVINASINLGVRGRDDQPRPPIECYFRVIDEPVLRLVSVDLQAAADVRTIGEVFDFARDYLGLLKAAVIASGLVPPGMEGCGLGIESLLQQLVGQGRGLELVSKVNDIPKGSRLAVSTNLLGSLISVCMRATGQVASLIGDQSEADRRLIAARAILGEWIGGSGGGWQDSGGVWPGIKLIEGKAAEQGDPELGVSRGRLLPRHTVFGHDEVSPATRKALQDSLVLVHGGMAQNVGPILEMVTEKYLLRSPVEWEARREAIEILGGIADALRAGDIREIGRLTHRNFYGPLQKIIPWCTNLFTNRLVEAAEQRFGEQFWGFWMLGGMSGGGMGFIFDPAVKPEAQDWLQQELLRTKQQMESRLPFAMDPVVYDFEINDRGTWAELRRERTPMPQEYYALLAPQWLKRPTHELSSTTRAELRELGAALQSAERMSEYRRLIESILPAGAGAGGEEQSLDQLLDRSLDREQHEQIRADLRSGRYSLAQNRLPRNTTIEDVRPEDVIDARSELDARYRLAGQEALVEGRVAVVTLAAGVGSRWTEGAGVVKGLHPFCEFAGRHRSFLETHLAKSRRIGDEAGAYFPHVITTGYMTHEPIRAHLEQAGNYGYPGQVLLSPGRYVGLRMIPMVRDLRFAWEELAQQQLDEQQEKVRASVRAALIQWARQSGEGSDYRDNHPSQCLHPVGHWYEVPNLLRNGTLARLLEDQPQLEHLMLHNIDTLGADVDPALLGLHMAEENGLTFEVITRRLEDRGGGLARVNGRPRLLEGLAMPSERDEFQLSYYNSMTTWIHIDRLLSAFGLTRGDLSHQGAIEKAVREMSYRMPTYITLKDVKKRWGNGQEDIYPVSQFEKLWGDMSALADIRSGFVVVDQRRGQQLKEQAQLDGWLRDGSARYVDELCAWS